MHQDKMAAHFGRRPYNAAMRRRQVRRDLRHAAELGRLRRREQRARAREGLRGPWERAKASMTRFVLVMRGVAHQHYVQSDYTEAR